MTTRQSLLACAAALLFADGAAAADPFTVFDLPLGGKVAQLPICPFNTDLAKTNCWVSKPFTTSEGGRMGMVHLAKKDKLPSWAEYSTFNFTLTKGLVLEEISVETRGTGSMNDILNSISSRFGPPQPSQRQGRATWSAPEARIGMQCDTKCWVTFSTPDAQAKRDREIEDQKAVKAARPVSP